jgi:3-hydroxyacyl-CoA dehydrogenase
MSTLIEFYYHPGYIIDIILIDISFGKTCNSDCQLRMSVYLKSCCYPFDNSDRIPLRKFYPDTDKINFEETVNISREIITMSFKKVAVIGAGTMGAGIAGQVANAGVDVLLMDLPGDDANVNSVAERGFNRLLDPNQPGLMSEDAQGRIQLGNIRDDFELLKDCDWIAEAVVERLDIKRELYQRLYETCSDQVIVTSNTSTIPIRLLVEDFPEEFQKRFAITHFFNPVRFMRLLELVRGDITDDAVIDQLDNFCEQRLGKGVVRCRDTPGFLGNRVGVYAIQCALHAAFDLGLTPGEADAIFGRPMGIPKTGVFGLYDLIGIDLMADVVQSLVNILPAHDAFHAQAAEIPLMSRMIANGQTGNKQGQGFYRQEDDGDHTQRYALNLVNEKYERFDRLTLPLAEETQQKGLGVLLSDETVYGEFAWRVLSKTLCYSASLVPEVGDDPVGIDDAMKLGYNWLSGPFEMLDEIGVDYFIDRLESENIKIPEYLQTTRGDHFYRVENAKLKVRKFQGALQTIQRPRGVVRFTELRRTLKPEVSNEMASWYIVDDAALVEFHSKANALDGESMAILADAVEQVVPRNLKGLVVHNDAQHFSCGVNLGAVRQFYQQDDLEGLDQFLGDFQQTVLAMRQVEYPVVVAPVGLSLGGGFEVVLHGKQVICHANSVMGLVESLVGVIPSGGGCKETLYRWVAKLGCEEDIHEACWKAFMNIGYGRTATSPLLAAKLAMLRDNDRYEMNRDRLFSAAMNALDEPAQQRPFSRPVLPMPGQELFSEMVDWLVKAHNDDKLTPHDVVGTRARIDNMLEFGKPLRN